MGTMFSIIIGRGYLRIENCSMRLHLKQLAVLYHLPYFLKQVFYVTYTVYTVCICYEIRMVRPSFKMVRECLLSSSYYWASGACASTCILPPIQKHSQ